MTCRLCLPGSSVLALALLAAAAPSATAQTPLGRPNAKFPEDFGSIQTVRELRDGRVLVADPLGKELYLVDLAAGTRTVVGSQGQGPNEYLQPDAVWALPGDSTLLVDLGNGRVVALGPDLGFGPTLPISALKSYTGHTLGACGALESLVAIRMMNEGWFHGTANLASPDSECAELDYLTGEGRRFATEYVMNNNFAFGGINTSLIFKRFDTQELRR